MGTQLSACKPINFVTQQPVDVEKQINIYKWRADPNFNEYISRTYLNQEYLNGHKTYWINNQDYHKQFKFEKYICNLDMLQNSLNFQDCIYVLKSLILGFQEIFNFFGKAYVDEKCCFLTKEGQIRAWINPNYQSNTFSNRNLLQKQQFSYRDTTQRFITEQQWKNSKKISMSQANIIQNVINLVSKMLKQQNYQYLKFLQKIDQFIVSNIIKNYNFKRVNKFINRYIYQKKICAAINLKAKIQELYNKQQGKRNKNSIKNCKSSTNLSSSKNLQSKMDHQPDNYSINYSSQTKINELNQAELFTKKKNSFAQSKKNSFKNSSKFYQIQRQKQKQYHSTASSSKGFRMNFKRDNEHSHTQYYPVNDLNNKNYHFQNRYIIQPQFSISLLNHHHVHQRSISQMDKKSVSFHTPKSSILSNKSSFKIKNLDFRSIYDKDLGIISQKKQTQQSQASYNLFNNLSFNPKTQEKYTKNPEVLRKASIISQISSKSNNTIKNYQNKQNNLEFQFSGYGKKNFKKSTTSIHNNYPQQDNTKMFKSNCLQNRPSPLYDDTYTTKKYDEGREKSQFQFTMKTITRLISNDEELEQHQSQGQFSSSYLNQSSYSGVLASMGRSIHLQQMPKKQKRNNFKKSECDN